MPLNIGVQGPTRVSPAARSGRAIVSDAMAARSKAGFEQNGCFIQTQKETRALLSTKLVVVSGDWIVRIGGTVSIIINRREARVPIDKCQHGFGVSIEGRIRPAGATAMPGKRGVRGPFHNQQSAIGVSDGL